MKIRLNSIIIVELTLKLTIQGPEIAFKVVKDVSFRAENIFFSNTFLGITA